MRQKSMWIRVVSIVALVAAITVLDAGPAPVDGFGSLTSQGVQVHRASQWHDAGITGQGVKVGIIDTGFAGIQSLLGTELPATVRGRCYTDIGRFTSDLADCHNNSNHGTRVAESLMDTAPGVTLYIARPTTLSGGDLRASVDWMISQGVKVINYSVGWPMDGPGDGTSPLSTSPLKTIDHAVRNGVLWVNSTSNAARSTWFISRPFSDHDGDGIVNFSSVDEGITINVDRGDVFMAEMRWDDSWGGASRDMDLYLVNRFNRTVAESIDHQNGGARDYPLERILGEFQIGGRYALAIVHHGGDTPRWTQLRVWGLGAIEHYTLRGSVFNPEESSNPGMLAVGASHWDETSTIAWYSGRGPTTDGRIKPEIVGADCAVTTSRREFCGASQSSPHVSGMAALVLQRFPHYSPVDVAQYLKRHAAQRSSPDPNNTWGHGFALLPQPMPPPSPAINAPVQSGNDWLSVSWTPRTQAGIEPATSYDLRYILAAADSSVDSNWTLVPNAGHPASRSYRITGLSGNSSYRIQVRGKNTWGPGQWSTAVNAATSSPVLPNAPTGLTARKVGASVELAWVAPDNSGGTPITGYVVELSIDNSLSWAVVYTTSNAATSYTDDGTDSNGPAFGANDSLQYRVSAINSVGQGPASNVATVTAGAPPSGNVSATRSFSPTSVAPGGQVTVTITAANYGIAAGVTETLPTGFTYVSSNLPDDQVTEVDARTIKFTLFGDTSFTYTVTAPSAEGSYTFSGTLRDSDRNDHAISGTTTVMVTVSSGDSLVARYDANGNGRIEKSEVIAAINDYLFGSGGNVITKAEVIWLINLYLFG